MVDTGHGVDSALRNAIYKTIASALRYVCQVCIRY